MIRGHRKGSDPFSMSFLQMDSIGFPQSLIIKSPHPDGMIEAFS